jgi:hypothetical protein
MANHAATVVMREHAAVYNMYGCSPVSSPKKEIRQTRGHDARVMVFVASVMLLAVARDRESPRVGLPSGRQFRWNESNPQVYLRKT